MQQLEEGQSYEYDAGDDIDPQSRSAWIWAAEVYISQNVEHNCNGFEEKSQEDENSSTVWLPLIILSH